MYFSTFARANTPQSNEFLCLADLPSMIGWLRVSILLSSMSMPITFLNNMSIEPFYRFNESNHILVNDRIKSITIKRVLNHISISINLPYVVPKIINELELESAPSNHPSLVIAARIVVHHLEITVKLQYLHNYKHMTKRHFGVSWAMSCTF